MEPRFTTKGKDSRGPAGRGEISMAANSPARLLVQSVRVLAHRGNGGKPGSRSCIRLGSRGPALRKPHLRGHLDEPEPFRPPLDSANSDGRSRPKGRPLRNNL